MKTTFGLELHRDNPCLTPVSELPAGPLPKRYLTLFLRDSPCLDWHSREAVISWRFGGLMFIPKILWP